MIELTERGFRVVAPMTIVQARGLLEAGCARLGTVNGTVEIDLSAVPDADSSALAILFGWLRCRRDVELRLVGAPDAVRSLADMYGVAGLLSLN